PARADPLRIVRDAPRSVVPLGEVGELAADLGLDGLAGVAQVDARRHPPLARDEVDVARLIGKIPGDADGPLLAFGSLEDSDVDLARGLVVCYLRSAVDVAVHPRQRWLGGRHD